MASREATDIASLPSRSPRHLSEMSRNRELLLEFLRRDIRARYRGSSLGVAWSLFNPLIYTLVYSAVFSTIIRFPVKGGAPYAVFILSGLLAWNFFAQSATASVASILGNGQLIKHVAFPRILLTFSSVLAAFVNYLISLALLIPVVLLFHAHLGVPLLALPVIVLITFAFALGFGLLTAAANVYLRDIEYLLGIALQVWFFLTPIIYPLDLITGTVAQRHATLGPVLRWIFYLNPMTWVATSFQDVIGADTWPSHLAGLGYSATVAAAVLVAGFVFFTRLQGQFAEEL